MYDVIDSLEHQHEDLVKHLTAIREGIFQRATVVAELRKAKKMLLDHLKVEDDVLYKAMSAKPETQVLAKQFAEKMQAISVDVVAFFLRYDVDGDAAFGMDFRRDLGRLMFVLGNRIRQEETILYPAYRKLMSTSAA